MKGSAYVDLDLSWLQATGQIRYLASDSPTATSTDNCWGLRYEKLQEQAKVNAQKLFTGNDFPVDILVQICKGTIIITITNKHTQDAIDKIRYGLYCSRNRRAISKWLIKHVRNSTEVIEVVQWLRDQITLDAK